MNSFLFFMAYKDKYQSSDSQVSCIFMIIHMMKNDCTYCLRFGLKRLLNALEMFKKKNVMLQ